VMLQSIAVSIPRSGFCWFGPILGGEPGASQLDVSIPRSGFCWFGPFTLSARFLSLVRFNPSVGILLVWTSSPFPVPSESQMFQSLGRDSVGLDKSSARGPRAAHTVSIPRSGFCWFGQHCQRWLSGKTTVSIPRSGFCWFGPARPRRGVGAAGCFNPSVGILLVWTDFPIQHNPDDIRFQSLGRDSVGLDLLQGLGHVIRVIEFQSLGRDSVGLDPVIAQA